MSEIEVGKFVRTIEGHIGRIKDLDIDVGICLNNLIEPITIDEIAKHSHNIIDLIEVGDIVEIHKAYNEKETILYHMIDKQYTESFTRGLKEEYIASILTHEQFTQNAYELEK